MAYKILLLGPQGSGKGTQAEFLSDNLGIPAISMGNLWRKEIEQGTDWGRAYKKAYDEGKLAPDEQTSELARRRILEPDTADGFIFDGYPRNLAQQKRSEKFLEFTDVVVLTLTDKDAIVRLAGRRICPKCGKNFHLKYNPPADDEICDDDKQELIVRDDDRAEAIEKRLKIYHQETEPLVELYRRRGVVHEINGARPIKKVHEDIIKALKH